MAEDGPSEAAPRGRRRRNSALRLVLLALVAMLPLLIGLLLDPSGMEFLHPGRFHGAEALSGVAQEEQFVEAWTWRVQCARCRQPPGGPGAGSRRRDGTGLGIVVTAGIALGGPGVCRDSACAADHAFIAVRANGTYEYHRFPVESFRWGAALLQPQSPSPSQQPRRECFVIGGRSDGADMDAASVAALAHLRGYRNRFCPGGLAIRLPPGSRAGTGTALALAFGQAVRWEPTLRQPGPMGWSSALPLRWPAALAAYTPSWLLRPKHQTAVLGIDARVVGVAEWQLPGKNATVGSLVRLGAAEAEGAGLSRLPTQYASGTFHASSCTVIATKEWAHSSNASAAVPIAPAAVLLQASDLGRAGSHWRATLSLHAFGDGVQDDGAGTNLVAALWLAPVQDTGQLTKEANGKLIKFTSAAGDEARMFKLLPRTTANKAKDSTLLPKRTLLHALLVSPATGMQLEVRAEVVQREDGSDGETKLHGRNGERCGSAAAASATPGERLALLARCSSRASVSVLLASASQVALAATSRTATIAFGGTDADLLALADRLQS
jgi:hypothetical protein